MINRKVFFISIAIFCLSAYLPASIKADTFILKNGNRTTGKLISETETHYIVEIPDIGELRIAKDSVEKVLKEEEVTPDEKVKSLKAVSTDELVKNLVKTYRSNPLSKKTPVLAVIPFRVEDPKLRKEKIGFGIAELITDNIVGNWMKEFRVVERSQLDKVLSEQKMSLTGVISDESAIQIGKILNADLLLIGSVAEMHNNYLINARMVSADTGRVLAAGSTRVRTKKIHNEAGEYIELSKNHGFYYGIVSLKLKPIPLNRSDEFTTYAGATAIMTLTSRHDYNSWSGLLIGYRRFLFNKLLFDFGVSPTKLTDARHSISKVDSSGIISYETSSGSPIEVLFQWKLQWMQDFWKGYVYGGGGLTLMTESASGGTSTHSFPMITAGYELRVRERIGINFSGNYFLNAGTIKNDIDLNIATLPIYTDVELFELDPLSFTATLGFYF